MKKRLNYAEMIKETGILTFAVAIIAAAVSFFLVPSHTSVSSISGPGHRAVQLCAAAAVGHYDDPECGAAAHRVLLPAARIWRAKTVYTSIMLPLFLGLFEKLFPDFGSMTDSQELDVLCYILVVSVGLSILFNRNAVLRRPGYCGEDHE